MRFKNLKLATKQGLGFGIILVIMAGVTVFSLIKMSVIKDKIDEVNASWLPSVIALSEMSLDTSEYRMNELQHAFTYYGYEIRAKEQEMIALRERMEKNQELYETLISSPEEQALYTSFREKWKQYLELHEKYMKLSRDNQDEEAVKLLNNESRDLFDSFGADLAELVKLNKKGSVNAARRAEQTYSSTRLIIKILLSLTVLMSTLIALVLVRTITTPVKKLERAARRVAEGNFDVSLDIDTEEELGNLAKSFNQMTDSLRDVKAENEKQDWFKTGQNELNEEMRGNQDVMELARKVITHLAKYLDAQIGALYLVEEESETLRLTGSYAFTKRKHMGDVIRVGEGLVGQAAFEKEIISVTSIPEDYIRINSAIGDTTPRNIVVSPFLYQDTLTGVIELGSFREFTDDHLEFLRRSMESIAIGFNSALSGNKIKYLLEESQQQAEELQVQQEELRTKNEELAAQTDALRSSEAKLINQQEELQAANEELEEKTQYLEKQKIEIVEKNLALETARSDLEQKAKELEITSKYKSEFLANMSHELRTPLNSLLILARTLADNEEGNLSEEQVECSRIIYKSGDDLLKLINDILDLSKIEAGKMLVNIETVRLISLADNVRTNFSHVLADKGLTLAIDLSDDLPESLDTDQQKLEQITKNFLSNAIKFTEKGTITFSIHLPRTGTDLSRSGLDIQNAIGFSVSDTGIGIPREKLLDIFEAFQQVDGSTSRKYGGTGLGLSISRELAKLLGGEIHLQSEEGKGTTFTVYLPLLLPEKTEMPKPDPDDPPAPSPVPQDAPPEIPDVPAENEPSEFDFEISKVPDDREDLKKDDETVLIIEDDPEFAKILLDHCHQKGFKGLVSMTGEAGLSLAEKHEPVAIILDIKLPGISGWVVLDTLKANAKTRHIPVHMMSAEVSDFDAFKKGAIGFLSKPAKKEELEVAFRNLEEFINKNIKDLLVVEDNAVMREGIRQLIGNGDVKTTEAETGEEAIRLLKEKNFDCMVLDLGLPDMTGSDLLTKLEAEKEIRVPPVIIYTGKELTREEEETLRKYANSIIVKGARSEERLLDETALFLHRVVDKMPQENQKMLTSLHDRDSMFVDKNVLLVDDDMRNVFALSKVLKDKGMNILKAENGEKALKVLEEEPDVDLVLMDIMMPVMDGYETMKNIRAQEQFKKLPIIALTAKAMKGDRGKCIAAGASDYLPKPVDIERLLSMMRVWLYA